MAKGIDIDTAVELSGPPIDGAVLERNYTSWPALTWSIKCLRSILTLYRFPLSVSRTMSNPYRPNVPASQLFAEKTWLQGGILSAVAYGVVLTLFSLNFCLLREKARQETHENSRRRQRLALLVYTCFMFILSTLTMASQAEMTQLGFIDNRDFPGGPAAYETVMFSIPISMLGNVLTGITYLVRISRLESGPWHSTAFTLIYGFISLSLNILLTLMISIRLYFHRRRVYKVLGKRHGSHYTSIISLLVESASIQDVVVLFFLISFILGSPVANIALSTLVQVQTIASFMIIYRVAQGTAWNSGTASDILTEDVVRQARKFSNIRFTGTTVGIETSVSIDESSGGQNELPMGRDKLSGMATVDSNCWKEKAFPRPVVG
ncbi:hypothetical protein K443DRAFT_134787 [Laccaria amethystina LaAM-08-1]|uniref:Uncharacterized protein n=1 Tax=Laccaria amethystina LaAM-08-1 TaxID=1095629 RepID=A0A0C9XDQ4_9AGAR|nr:hypothetical protein K443DRAFT_134787 [Laccaria amethystina LaAM-08-1]